MPAKFLSKNCLWITLVAMICAAVGGFFGLRTYFIFQAHSKADKIINSVVLDNTTETEVLLRIAAEVHEEFSETLHNSILILRLRPYLTHPLLPDFVRFPKGAIETVIQEGLCDNAARNLAFVLEKLGYEALQWDMIQTGAAHSALLVTLSSSDKVLLDPFYGAASYSGVEKKLISPERAQEKLRDGGEVTDYFVPLSEDSQLSFYDKLANTWMAAEGEQLVIEAEIPDLREDPLLLGLIDGNSDDVVFAALDLGLTSYWSYVGHKYNRSWVRVLKTTQDVEVDFTLVQEVESSVVTSEPAPEIEGRHMRWELKAGEEIRFFDGRAERSFTRMNSYLDVDQIEIRPIS